jgi:hypothetical protein
VPLEVDAHVSRHSQQPWQKAVGIDLLPMVPESDQHILRDVPGILAASEEKAGESEDTILIFVNATFEFVKMHGLPSFPFPGCDEDRMSIDIDCKTDGAGEMLHVDYAQVRHSICTKSASSVRAPRCR